MLQGDVIFYKISLSRLGRFREELDKNPNRP